jgi:hypothetical protein
LLLEIKSSIIYLKYNKIGENMKNYNDMYTRKLNISNKRLWLTPGPFLYTFIADER